MMIKCQKCGFENQMGSIFCRECGEKLNMDAIDPNKLQKDVNKEKNIKLAKKRVKGAISGGVAILVVVAFIFLVFPDLFPFGGLRVYEEPEVKEASANQKFNAAVNGTSVGKVKYSYPEINQMLKTQVVNPLSELDSFAKVTAIELAFDETKNQPVAYVWISIKEKVPVLYTIHGAFQYNSPSPDTNEVPEEPISVDVKRLDIGRLPLFVSTHTFLNGFKTLVNNDAMRSFFGRAEDVEFTSEGMNVVFKKGGPTNSSYTPAASAAAPVSSAKAASNASSKTASAKSTAASEKAEAARIKAEEEKAKQEQLAEERKRKAEEYRQQQKEKEEERKRKLEEEKERRKQEEEERKRKIEEEAQRRRDEAEERRREREERRNNNNNYNNGRNSRSSRSSRSSSSRNRY